MSYKKGKTMKYIYNVSDGGCNTYKLSLYNDSGKLLDTYNMGKVYKNLKSLDDMAKETANMLIREIELRKIFNR